MARAMKKYKNEQSFKNTTLQMPAITLSTQLKDLVGSDSWLLFRLMNEQPAFLTKPASMWEKDDDYVRIKSRLSRMKVVNEKELLDLSQITITLL